MLPNRPILCTARENLGMVSNRRCAAGTFHVRVYFWYGKGSGRLADINQCDLPGYFRGTHSAFLFCDTRIYTKIQRRVGTGG